MKMRNLLLILFIIISVSSYGQYTREEYIKKYQVLAIQEMNRSGIPASIKMAQACLESRDGNSELSVRSNNHFGIKCKRNWIGEKVYHDDDRRNECFRKYTTVEESYIDHTNFLMENRRYRALFKLKPTDYKGWAKGLKKAGYATAPHYARELIRIIEDNKLHRLDYKLTWTPIENRVAADTPVKTENVTSDLVISAYENHKVIEINGVKAVVALENDSYEMIAQELGKEAWQLYKYNDQIEGHRPQKGEVVYIKKKKRRASKDHLTHIVSAGESMHYISQLYGIRLKPLYRRNLMDFGTHPKVGQVIYLRRTKP